MIATNPSRDRITAITITVALHALVIVSVVSWKSGGMTGRGPLDDANGEGEQTWVSVDFLGEPNKPVPRAVTMPPPQIAAPVTDPLAATPAADPGVTSTDPPRDAASPAQSGGGNGEPTDDLGARYLAAVRKAILDQWSQQGGGAIPAGCKVNVDQVDGGAALRAWVIDCGDLPLTQRIRLETAVMKAPLPYAGFEPVFQEHLELTF